MFLLLGFTLLLSSCNKNPDTLKVATKKLKDSKYISYSQSNYYLEPENPELFTSYNEQIEVLFNDKDSLGFNYIYKNDMAGDRIYLDGRLQIVNHKDSIVRILLPKHFKDSNTFKKVVKFRDKWSPMVLLDQEWKYVKDTIVNESNFKDYFQIVKDTVFEGIRIYTEYHIFINPNTSLLEMFERRNYNDGILTQRIKVKYSNYKLSQKPIALSYGLSENYNSAFGPKKMVKSLEVGQVAPEFNALTIDGDSVSLEMFKGKKVLLNFSVIGCGGCVRTMKHFNQNGYELTDKISVLYINPEDDESRMKTYIKKTNIPFPVIAKAQRIAEKYRIIGYPTFFLVDENGRIENIQSGYSKGFIDGLRR